MGSKAERGRVLPPALQAMPGGPPGMGMAGRVGIAQKVLDKGRSKSLTEVDWVRRSEFFE
jgi:hypothetical protein